MNTKTTIAWALSTLVIGAGTGWWLGSHPTAVASGMAATPATQGERKVLYWFDPMKPDTHFDQPGKSPFMDMALLPRYADETTAGASTGVRIDPALLQNTGVKLGVVSSGMLDAGLDVSGSVAFNDRDVAIIQARTGGIVERVYPLAVGDVIAAGAPLADVRVPEWLAAQNEYLALRHDAELGAAAAARLQQLGMSAAQIDRLQRTGQPAAVVTISAPRAGMVADLAVRQGMVLAAGAPLARINGLASVWIEAEVPEAQAASIKLGAPICATLAAWPNEPLKGKVTALIPELDQDTRTLRVRAEVPNRQGLLRPGMFARITLDRPDSQSVLLVPSASVIATGKRQVVIVADGAGRFTPAEVQTGRERNGQSEVISGLQAGEKVVISGQFLIDSEASLKGVLARMAAASTPASAQSAQGHPGSGVVKAVSGESITLAHEAIQSLGWPAMTMPFSLARPELAHGLKPGDKVHFTLLDKDGTEVIESIAVQTVAGVRP